MNGSNFEGIPIETIIRNVLSEVAYNYSAEGASLGEQLDSLARLALIEELEARLDLDLERVLIEPQFWISERELMRGVQEELRQKARGSAG